MVERYVVEGIVIGIQRKATLCGSLEMRDQRGFLNAAGQHRVEET
jgi:hypothetical protein